MCGISGFLSKNTRPTEFISIMNSLVHHRGPDDEGYVLFDDQLNEIICSGKDTPSHFDQPKTYYTPDRNINDVSVGVRLALGHRRLSIIDLSSYGHQPMCTGDQRYWIVYNGEIYNYLELRIELQKLGYEFISTSDTEVILNAYREWGVDCQHRFNGMWAFAIFDKLKKKVFFARDRFGIKPFYYWVHDETIYFGSEIKQFTSIPGWYANINPQKVYDYLTWGITDHTDETLFKGVYQLRPGHLIELKIDDFNVKPDGRLQMQQWYELRPENFTGTIKEASDEFRNRLINSISLRLRSDVTVGSCLSGGLDSSSIVCIMDELLNKNQTHNVQKTFSACSTIDRFDEKKWIDQVVEHTNVKPYFVYPTLGNLFSEMPQILWHQDEPFGSSSIYAQWNVFKLASDNGVKVILDGQGADELLAGYHSYFGPRFNDLLRDARFHQLLKEIHHNKRMHGIPHLMSIMQLAKMIFPDSILDPIKRVFGRPSPSPVWLNQNLLDFKQMNPDNSNSNSSTVNGKSYSQLTSTNLPMLLHYEDRNSMAHSIESRVPFLDYKLVEFAFGLPTDYKIYEGATKRVMRAGMSGIIPDNIRDRHDKIGFATPEEDWLRKIDQGLFRKKMTEAVSASDGILNGEAVKHLDDVISGKLPYGFIPWRLINFGEWMKKFGVSTSL